MKAYAPLFCFGASFPTGSASEAERHACLLLLTCSELLFHHFSLVIVLVLRLSRLYSEIVVLLSVFSVFFVHMSNCVVL